jgi:hypothetical protein
VIGGIDWASWGTAVGTLVLAAATFASIRSANRSARNAERALQIGLRPVLFASRPHETIQKINWGDGHWTSLPPGRAVLEHEDGVIYMAMSLLNVGSGIAILHGWRIDTAEPISHQASLEDMRATAMQLRPDRATFRPQTRDMYAPPGDLSFWQAAIRTPNDPDRQRVEETIASEDRRLIIDLLYGDHEGGQETISRFSVSRYPGKDEWFPAVVRHWYLNQ